MVKEYSNLHKNFVIVFKTSLAGSIKKQFYYTIE
jgi:hypothetical protein